MKRVIRDGYQDVVLSHLHIFISDAPGSKPHCYLQIKEQLPKNGEQNALQTVCDDTCLKATTE